MTRYNGWGTREIEGVRNLQKAEERKTPSRICLAQPLAQSAYVERYIGVWLSDYLPSGRLASATIQTRDGSPCGKMEIIHGLHPSQKPVQFSLLAISLCTIGKRDKDINITKQGLTYYSTAVKELSKAIVNPSLSTYDGNLAASKVLTLFELIHAIKDRSRFIFNSPEWRTIPWEFHPKTSRDLLFDILGDMTEVIVDSDQMRACQDIDRRKALADSVISSCWNLEDRLQTWFQEAAPLRPFRDKTGELIDPCGADDFAWAHLTTIYWSTCLLLYYTFRSVSGPSMALLPHMNPTICIRELALALPYFWRPGAGLMGADMAAFPLGICMHILYAGPIEESEDRMLLEELVTSPGVQDTVLKFLRSLQRDSARQDMVQIDGVEGLRARARSWSAGKQ
ncbi:hypothetical protein F5Y15DRAFT_418527 [Xylariaceae sp. FL0016]|nr:hypothetical protein F5Y15DRAFT_418527 [Xylariaceae sp. FL0016]